MLKNNKQQGFTIVELLIVIVVIAILAAISIVAYGGIQNRGKTSSGQSLAGQIAKKVEAYNTLAGVYPSNAQLTGNTAPSGFTGSLLEAKLDTSSSAIAADVTTTSADGGKVVTYVGCGTTGGKVAYWDYAASSPAIVWKYLGNATSASTGCA